MEKLVLLLAEFLRGGDLHRWIIDPAVHFDGRLEDLQVEFDDCSADLLATVVRNHATDPGWTWWPSLKDDMGLPACERAWLFDVSSPFRLNTADTSPR